MLRGQDSNHIRAGTPADIPSLLDALAEVHRVSGYPPRTGPSRAALHAWLAGDEPVARVVLDVDGQACGHMRIIEPRPYLKRFMTAGDFDIPVTKCLEIGQLFVAPQARKQGAGQQLTEHAVGVVAELGRHALLAAIGPESTQRLYVRAGLRRLGTFHGKDGINTVMIWMNPHES